MNEEIQSLKRYISIPKYIVISSHRNPDGDAIGSCLALAGYLNQLGHTVRIVLPSELPSSFDFLEGIDDLLIFDLKPNECIDAIKMADMFFALDYNSLDRIDKMAEAVMQSESHKIMIDHHLDPEPFADTVISDPKASSTCELMFETLKALGCSKFSSTMLNALYTGIVTDTGCFRHAVSPRLMVNTAELIALGADHDFLVDKIFNSQPEKNLRLIGHCLHNRLEIFPEYHTALIYLKKEDYEEYDIQRGDTEGIVNYLLMLKNIKVAAIIMEQPNIVKISLRSKGDFSVQDMARRFFNGGGHKNASGGFLHSSISVALKKFKDSLESFPSLISTKEIYNQ
jgi:bifunctional oligoribonuclease and PAP phosphatase NrnA